MTDFNRSTLPDTVRSNGAPPNPWWANAVVYQIYRVPSRIPTATHRRPEGHHQPSRLPRRPRRGRGVVEPGLQVAPDDNGYDISDYQTSIRCSARSRTWTSCSPRRTGAA